MKNLLLLFAGTLFILFSKAQTAPQLIFSTQISTGLSAPVDVVNAGDGTNRIFIVQRGGTIAVYNSTYTLLNANFLTISTNFTTGGERGLLSVVFHPDYENNRYFFVYYTNAAGGVNIDRFQTNVSNPNLADASSRTNIMSFTKPVVYSNHNGGKLNFGADGNLYFGLGDSGSGGDPGNLAQNGNSYWGKLIRINVDNFTISPFYTVPSTNPFVADANVLDEIYSIGLRNPWRWSFDRLNNDIWIGDVGQDAKEEVNKVVSSAAAGKNYGWRCYEGTGAYNTSGCLPISNYQAPIFEYPHNNTTGGYSITGGYVYRGTQYPSLYGYYVCVDYVSRNGWLIKETSPGVFTNSLQANFPAGISSFGETENGEMLVLTLAGTLSSVSTNAVLPLSLIAFDAAKTSNNVNTITWQTNNESALVSYTIQQSDNGIIFTDISTVSAQNTLQANYSYLHNTTFSNKIYYRLKILAANGNISYSNIDSLMADSNGKEIIISNVTSSGVTVLINRKFNNLLLYDSQGKLLVSKTINGFAGVSYKLDINLANGVYFLKATDGSKDFSTARFIY